jgi:hypothetical protein
VGQEVVVPSLPTLEQECFFIAPIGQDGSEERHRSDGVLEFIVARGAAELGLQAIRADQLAEPGQITLQVIEHVLGAKAAVADLTGRNPNVYYELAIRHTAKLPTVLICEQGEELPFDIAQMRTVFFSHTDLRSADHCRAEIVRHLREALDGAVDSPVAASVDLQRLQAGNTMERSVAELVTGVADLQKAMHDIGVVVRSALGREASGDLRYAAKLRPELEHRLDALMHLAQERKDTDIERRLAEVLAWVRRSSGVQVVPYLQLRLPEPGRPGYLDEFDKFIDALEPSPEELSRARHLRARLERWIKEADDQLDQT